MKKFVSLMMAACSVLSVGVMLASCSKECEHTWDAGVVTTPATFTAKGEKKFTCTACSETKTEEFEAVTTVTADQWASAFNFGDGACHLTITASAEMTQGGITASMAMGMEYIVNENVMYGKSTESMTMNGETQEEVYEMYYVKDGDAYYEFSKETVEGQLVWVRETITAEEFANAKTEVDLSEGLPFAFANATYDAATKTYTVADIPANADEYQPGYKNIKLQFADGKLYKITCVMDQFGTEMEYVITASYANVTVPAIPTDFVNGDADQA